MPNSGMLTINKEDHTMGNLIRMQLLRDKQVKFAGYIHPHPLIHKIELRVQTMDRALSSPMQALVRTYTDLGGGGKGGSSHPPTHPFAHPFIYSSNDP